MRLSHEDRRHYPRHLMGGKVNYKVFQGDTHNSSIDNVSWSGMKLREVDELGEMGLMEARKMLHQPITITFEGLDLEAHGTVTRVERKNMMLGVRISSTTNDEVWRKYCQC